MGIVGNRQEGTPTATRAFAACCMSELTRKLRCLGVKILPPTNGHFILVTQAPHRQKQQQFQVHFCVHRPFPFCCYSWCRFPQRKSPYALDAPPAPPRSSAAKRISIVPKPDENQRHDRDATKMMPRAAMNRQTPGAHGSSRYVCVFRTLCLSPSDATTEIDATSRGASTGSPIQSMKCSILMVSISSSRNLADTAGFHVGAMSQLASSMTAVYNH